MSDHVAANRLRLPIWPVKALPPSGLEMSATRYEIRVGGTLSDTLLLAFPQFTAEVHDGTTLLVGVLPDQAALHGMLSQVQALGLHLLEVRQRL